MKKLFFLIGIATMFLFAFEGAKVHAQDNKVEPQEKAGILSEYSGYLEAYSVKTEEDGSTGRCYSFSFDASEASMCDELIDRLGLKTEADDGSYSISEDNSPIYRESYDTEVKLNVYIYDQSGVERLIFGQRVIVYRYNTSGKIHIYSRDMLKDIIDAYFHITPSLMTAFWT